MFYKLYPVTEKRAELQSALSGYCVKPLEDGTLLVTTSHQEEALMNQLVMRNLVGNVERALKVEHFKSNEGRA
jgi:hypothetical protein